MLTTLMPPPRVTPITRRRQERARASQDDDRAQCQTLALTVSYHGAGFAGSQTQRGMRTVQHELEQALGAVLRPPVRTVFAGRTDRGVHAVGQVASCEDTCPSMSISAVRAALNVRLPQDLAVVDVERKPGGFHARYDAVWREYRYRIWNGAPQPLVADATWQRRTGLDLALMVDGAGRFVGEHDLASFAGGGAGVAWSDRRQRPRGTVRRILCCQVRVLAPWWGPPNRGQLIEVRAVADGFLPRMVRNMVGSLVDIGRGVRSPDWIDELLAVRDRRRGSMTAPARGLVLWKVGYAGDVPAMVP